MTDDLDLGTKVKVLPQGKNMLNINPFPSKNSRLFQNASLQTTISY